MGSTTIKAGGATALRILAVAAALAAPTGYAAATTRHHHVHTAAAATPAAARDYVGVYQGAAPGAALDQQDTRLFNRSGTVGREGLGESPFRPEGPGNVSD